MSMARLAGSGILSAIFSGPITKQQKAKAMSVAAA